ncbi:phosphoglycolate phosphatase [Shimia sp. FJ5]|uniref:phosphoglycolate phosphatase n=1 Tax=Shimia sp. FJ5 TaxID=3079054 RepID=UPI002612B545|nr:phosphoglycolate phosphatase [Shimia sp. FJ5]MDV4145403.1 phosphoglycolate phosphatase [Shimia sp. FJ5]
MKAIIFDLDGTLIDSAPDIHASVNKMLAAEGQDALDLSTVTAFIGNGLPKLVERVIKRVGMDMAEFDRIVADVLAIYNASAADLTRPYPHMAEVLAGLKEAGYRLGVCTNKPHEPAVIILQDLGLEGYFDVVIGGDSTEARKPDPKPLQAAMAALGGDVLYVGDSEIDAETAERAGVPFALFTEGYRKVGIDEMTHAYAFDDFRQLTEITGAVFA